MDISTPRVAIVYDKVTAFGGAERVLLALHEMFPEAPLFTAVYNPDTAPWAHVFARIQTSFVQYLPQARWKPQLYSPLMPLAFEQFDFKNFDIVISVTSYDAKGIITQPKTKHICYCLTPTRYLWSENGYEKFRGFGFLNKPIHVLKYLFLPRLRQWDQLAASRPDAMVTISNKVARRVKKYHKRDSVIVYPPVDSAFFTPSSKREEEEKLGPGKLQDYYLVVGRLVGYKRIDLVVKVFNSLKWPLVVIGRGSEEDHLKKMNSNPSTIFVGNVTDRELREYYRHCKALIMPQEEDFGIVGLEALSCGKPVISFKNSGIAELLNDKVGATFENQTEEDVKQCLEIFSQKRKASTECRRVAEAYDVKEFKKHFGEAISQELNKYERGI